MTVDNLTYPAPPQWLAALDAGLCDLAEKPETVEITPYRKRCLRVTNLSVNALMPYKSEDKDVWGKGSDCEDIAMAKRERLLKSDWPVGALRLTVLRLPDGRGHCVLSVMDGSDDPWILDCLSPTLSRQSTLEDAGDRFVAREMPGNREFWERLGPPPVINLAEVVEQAKDPEAPPKPKKSWKDMLPWRNRARV